MNIISSPKKYRILKFVVQNWVRPLNNGVFAFTTESMGRASLPWDAEYFDSTGNTVSITLAPGISSISPVMRSSEGGTLMTIKGKGFYQPEHTTEVLVGGDSCVIQSIDDTTILCRTSTPTIDQQVDEVFPGGAGAKTYYHDAVFLYEGLFTKL